MELSQVEFCSSEALKLLAAPDTEHASEISKHGQLLMWIQLHLFTDVCECVCVCVCARAYVYL